VAGATINDAALAYVGGALREYLAGHGELPEQSLVAACPMSLRESGEKASHGNALFGRLQTLGTDIADPLERLTAIAAAGAASRSGDPSTTSQLLELIGTVPTSLLGVTAKAASVLPFSGPTVANTTVTNVPGPTEPLYFSGARLVRAAGLGPLVGGLNLIHVVASYNGTLSISATADRDALPDPATYAECMDHAFQELLAAVD
jgi:WS/DGAT/MGAT family acyltransferase